MIALVTILLYFFAGCGHIGPSPQETATLKSLVQVDDYPLYTMVYRGAYDEVASVAGAQDASLVDLSAMERLVTRPA
jgi:hypothetical protein